MHKRQTYIFGDALKHALNQDEIRYVMSYEFLKRKFTEQRMKYTRGY